MSGSILQTESVQFDATGQKILLVEDNPSIRETFTFLLEDEGYCVEVVSNGKEALEWISQRGEPAAIFLDLNMPVMDGMEFLREKLRAKLAPRTPVIVFTAIGKKMKVEGVSEWIKKPVDLDRLLRVVSKYCNQYVLH